MAKLYTMMLKSVITSGDVIIGGWSLGGCIALEMAHLLQGHTHIHIKGLIMIDSIYPKFRPDALESETYHLEFLNTVPEHIRRSVQRCVDQAIYMLSRWQGPDWSERDIHDGSANCLFKTTGPPPTILIRATEALPSTWKPLDASPEEKLLRWDIYRENPFIRILDVPGHHFSMFESYNITKITDALQYACDVLEKL